MSQSPSEAIPSAPADSAAAQAPARSRIDIRALPFLRAVPALLAVACAGLAERLAADARTQGLSAPPTLSWLLFGLAAVLFLPAVWPVPALRPATPPALEATWQAFRRRPLVGVLLGAAILCGLAAIPLFTTINAHFGGTPPDEPANTGAWLLWIAALLLFGGAAVAWERGAPVPVEGTAADPPGDRLAPRVEWAILLGLLAFALLLRLPNLENDPPGLWFDEAQNGLVAGQLLAPGAAHPTFVGGFTQMGSLYFYVLAWVLRLFGGTIWPLRLLPALAGAAIAPLLYLLGARLYGWRVGLAAGGLVAVSAWNITFSRFGIASLPTVALDVAVFVCAMQGLRTGRLGYFAGAGVLLGLAMQMYYVARLVPLILAALLIHLLITQRMRLVRVARLGVVAFALGAALGFLPVGLFALQQPAAFGGRVDTVSIFNPQVNGGNLNAALSDNLSKHLLMFNFKGDGNGRHNLSDAPQLDDLTAALFILGLGTCLLRAWRWQYFFPVVWFGAALAGGVLSLPFEAPQSHRTLENSVVTALLAGIVLGELWGALAGRRRQAAEEAAETAGIPARPSVRFGFRRAQAKAQTTLPTRRSARPAPQPVVAEAPAPAIVPVPARVHDEPRNRRRLRLGVSALGVLAGVAWVASLTLPRYFVTQAQARGIWEDMNAPQAQAAQTLRRSAGQYRVYVSPGYLDTPAQHYLAADVPVTTWPGMEALPFDSTDNRDVLIILDPPLAGDISYIARMYPQATFEALRTPTGEGPLMWTIRVPASDIAGIHGVRAQVFDPGNATPRTDQTLPGATFDWQSAGGHAGTLRLATTLHIDRYGTYSFNWLPAGGAQAGSLRVDGYPVTPGGSLPLAIGLHSVVATDTVGSATGTAQLQWTPPGGTPAPIPATNLFDPRRIEPHGLTGIYRQGTDPTGPTANERVDAVISFFFHTPALGLGRPYNIAWSGRLYVPQTGSYKIGTEQITNSRLQVDGRELIVNTQPNNYQETELSLTAGWHDIQLSYVDAEPYAHIYLYWTPPGMGRSLIPAIFLWPQMGQYPAVPESGGWPTLADADGSVLPNGRPATGGPAPGAGLAAPPPAAAAPTTPPAPPAAAGPSPAAGTPLNPRLVLGNGDAPLAEPRGAAADAAGNLYIYTNGDSKVHVFSPDGKPLRAWDVRDQAGKPLVEGSALLVQGDTLWVLNAAASDLLGYSLSGQPAAPVHLCACFSPRGIALARDGSFWVADTGNNRVVQVAATGGILHTLGSKGNAPGQFTEPASVWQAADGTLYVADIGNSRVQSFGADGTPLAKWPVGPSIARDGNRLAGDSAGHVLVTEVASQAIVRYDAHGKELGRWTYAPQGASLVPAAGIAPAGADSFLVLFLQANLAAVFTPGK